AELEEGIDSCSASASIFVLQGLAERGDGFRPLFDKVLESSGKRLGLVFRMRSGPTEHKAIPEDDQFPAETDCQHHCRANQEALSHDDLRFARASPTLPRHVSPIRCVRDDRPRVMGLPASRKSLPGGSR